MENSFLKSQIDINPDSDFFIFKNEKELQNLLAFYEEQNAYLSLIQGPFGTFKSKIADYSLHFLKPEVLVFKFECFEASTLDDLFLSLFNDLKRFHQEGRISFSKIETNSLSIKINQYLSHINQPSVVIIDSIENILSNTQNKEEILNFVEHLISLNRFKVVLISREDNFALTNNESITRISLQSLKKEEINHYFSNLKIEIENEDIEKLFDVTKGNTSYISMSANIINTLKMPLKTLLDEFSKKKTTYEDFILQKLLAFVPENYKKILAILTVINTGLTRDFLFEAGFFTKDKLDYFIEKEVLCEENGYVFLKSYLKNYISDSISHFEKLKIHEYLKEFYEAQLPLKPNQRFVPLSRNTMRAQIAYHQSFLNLNPKKQSPQQDMTYAGYLNGNMTEWTLPERKTVQRNTHNTNISKKSDSKPQSTKNRSLEKYELTKEELVLLGLPVELSSLPIKQKTEISKEKSLFDLYSIAQSFEKDHDYVEGLDFYKQALKKYNEPEYEKLLPEILQGCVNCLRKLNKTDESIDYLEQIYNFYYTKNESGKANQILLEIAKTYKDSYRFLKAKEIYERLINSKLPVAPDTLARAHIAKAEILEDSSDIENSMKNYEKAFESASDIKDKSILAEAYFKYALILDDHNKTDSALEYYKKAVQISDKADTYTSSSYTNIAQILTERADYEEAYRNYRKALKYDSELLNYEGIYYLSSRLASICEKIKPNLVLNYLLKSLSAAKRHQDRFYIISSYDKIGDYYYKVKNYEKSLKAGLFAREILTKQDFAPQDLNKIDTRIKELKTQLSAEIFEQIVEGFRNNAV